MLKRLCDKCETEITDDESLFKIKCFKNGVLTIECDLCADCFNNLKGLFANNN